MPVAVTTFSAPDGLAALAAAIATMKGTGTNDTGTNDTDPFTPVTVVVPTNTCGVMARRALGRAGGVIGIDMVTLSRLAELIAGPSLAAQRRRPTSTPVLDITVRNILDEAPGMYRPVATHPSTTIALRDLHVEIRLAGREPAQRLRQSRRGQEVLRVSTAVTRELAKRWYDEADLFEQATQTVEGWATNTTESSIPLQLRHIVLYLPGALLGLAREFLLALGKVADVQVLATLTGDDFADHDTHELLQSLQGRELTQTADRNDGDTGATIQPSIQLTNQLTNQSACPERIVSVTDADDEVRHAIRAALDAARSSEPIAFHRMAIMWPADRPYARLVEHHLNVAGIPWNGRSGTAVAERLAPRLLLDLLDVDRRGLRRSDIFELLADIPARDSDGRPIQTAEWERVSRAAGVTGDDDWAPRLGALTDHARWGTPATELDQFVRSLRAALGHRFAKKTWWDWAEWCDEQLQQWLGKATINRLAEPEYRAYEALTLSLERLRHLDAVGEPVTRHQFRTVLEAELDAASSREGRVGNGITVGLLGSSAGLDIDVAIILGGAEGVLPTSPKSDPLLSDSDRVSASLQTSDSPTRRMLHQLLATIATARTTVTIPRGDLRATTQHEISRWIAPWTASKLSDPERDDPERDGPEPDDPEHSATATAGPVQVVASHTAGLAATVFPATAAEHRLRALLRTTQSDSDNDAPDVVLQRARVLSTARNSDNLSIFDGDLSDINVPKLTSAIRDTSPGSTDAGSDTILEAISPTQIEQWAKCPHAYFMRYLLGVYPVDEPGTDIAINALDRGIVQHDVLNRFHLEVISGSLPQPGPTGWTDTHRSALLHHFDEACGQAERRGRTGRPASWADEQARMRVDLLGWLEQDSALLAARSATPIASEQRFGSEHHVSLRLYPERGQAADEHAGGGRILNLRGSIDRVDRAADGSLIVTDHKTGKADKFRKLSSDDPTLDGSVFQLPAYAAAARALVGEPDVPVRAEYGMFARGKYERHGYAFTPEVWQQVSTDFGHVVDGIESGLYPAQPDRPGFRLWVNCQYCEPDGLGTDEPFARWQRKQHDPRLRTWFGPTEDDQDTPNVSKPNVSKPVQQ